MTSIGELIKEARKRKGLSQEKLAELVPCDSKMISRYENDEIQGLTDILKKMGEILDLQIEVTIRNTKPKLHYTFSELKELESKLINFSDKALIRLLFETPVAMDIDNINKLRITDINEESKTVSVIVHDETVETVVSEELIDYLKKAHQEVEYNTKIVEGKEGEFKITRLGLSVYVFKAGVDKHVPVPSTSFYGKIARMKDALNLDYLTVKTLMQSGMMYQAKLLKDRDGVLGEKQMLEVAHKYRWDASHAQDKVTYLRSNILNENVMGRLYK